MQHCGPQAIASGSLAKRPPAMGGDPEHFFGAEQLAEILVGALGEDDEIVAAYLHALQQLLGGHAGDIDHDLGMGALEAGQDHRQQAHRIIVGHAEADRAGQVPVGEMIEDFGIGAQHLAGAGIKRLAMIGQRHAAPVAGEQRHGPAAPPAA